MTAAARPSSLVRLARACSAVALAVLVGGAVVAQTAPVGPAPVAPAIGRPVAQLPRNEGIDWRSLAPAHRRALAPLEREWATLDAPQKQKWVELAQRLPDMHPAERERIQARMADWARMTPAERGQARLRYLQAKRAAGADDRNAQWEAYQSLPTDEKQRLAAKAQAQAASAAAASRKVTANAPSIDPSRTVPKSNLVTNPNFVAAPRAVAPTTIQARPGATTTLVSKPPTPPAHQQTGLPKIAASPGFVNQTTLLPQVGPQGAAAVPVRSDDDPDDDEPVPRP